MAHDIAAEVYSKVSGQPADGTARCGPRSPPPKEAADGYRLGCRQGRASRRRGSRRRLLRQSRDLGRGRLRAVRGPAGQDPVDPAHRPARQALGHHRRGAGRCRAAARRGARGQDCGRADARPGDRRGRGHPGPRPRGSEPHAGPRHAEPAERHRAARAAGARPHRPVARRPPPSRCATWRSTPPSPPPAACCASRSARASRSDIDQAIAELPRRLH